MARTVLVRYGAISEVARFAAALSEPIARGSSVVVRTHRGLEIGTLLEDAVPAETDGSASPDGKEAPMLVRAATPEDETGFAELQADCRMQFDEWNRRIREWKLKLDLLDLEWTLDRSKLVLYVLNDRGSDCTRLALHATAAGAGIVEVQPVSSEGLVAAAPSGGCGSGGCGTCDS